MFQFLACFTIQRYSWCQQQTYSSTKCMLFLQTPSTFVFVVDMDKIIPIFLTRKNLRAQPLCRAEHRSRHCQCDMVLFPDAVVQHLLPCRGGKRESVHKAGRAKTVQLRGKHACLEAVVSVPRLHPWPDSPVCGLRQMIQ